MSAFDTGIAAPQATFLDHAVLLSTTPGPTVMSGLLSDAVSSYSVLLTMMLTPSPQPQKLVVNNSWGMFNPAWDFPVGHPGNFSDNALHPFNVIVGSLEAAGADIFFAAGNCGRDCPDGRCKFGATLPICGANSHQSVMSIAGVDTTKLRVGLLVARTGASVAAEARRVGLHAFRGIRRIRSGLRRRRHVGRVPGRRRRRRRSAHQARAEHAQPGSAAAR